MFWLGFKIKRAINGDFTGGGIDGKQISGIGGKRITYRITIVRISGQRGNANCCADSGIFVSGIVGQVIIFDG